MPGETDDLISHLHGQTFGEIRWIPRMPAVGKEHAQPRDIGTTFVLFGVWLIICLVPILVGVMATRYARLKWLGWVAGIAACAGLYLTFDHMIGPLFPY